MRGAKVSGLPSVRGDPLKREVVGVSPELLQFTQARRGVVRHEGKMADEFRTRVAVAGPQTGKVSLTQAQQQLEATLRDVFSNDVDGSAHPSA